MGFRFTLKEANIVANLTFNRIVPCMREICASEEAWGGFLEFLYDFSNNYFTTQIDWEKDIISDAIDAFAHSHILWKKRAENKKLK